MSFTQTPFTETLKGATETTEKPAQIPYIVTTLTPKEINFTGMVWILRAVLILAAESVYTAEDMANELAHSFDEIANALFVLYWGGAIQLCVIEDLPTPISGDFAYRFAPLPMAIKLCGGGSYVRPDSDRTAESAPHTGFRSYQPARPGAGPVREAAPRSLFAA